MAGVANKSKDNKKDSKMMKRPENKPGAGGQGPP
jgi:hypothetical protein